MCDSEFYASPPLNEEDNSGQIDYFGQQITQQQQVANSHHQQEEKEIEEILHEDVLSPPRKNLAPLNSYQPSPEASFTCGFGHKEAQGKILPCFPVKEDGLMRITADTLNELLAGSYDDHIEQYVIIDCRFEYEYQGGHVEGAINLGTEKSVEKFLLEAGNDGNHLYENPEELPAPSKSGEIDYTGNNKKTILVFHCEFSAKRAPTLAKYLRSRDRALNHAAYPSVHFPELYILQGGYAECWKKYPDRCEPRGYTPMDDPRHLAARANDLGEMRRKRMGVRAKSYTFGEGMFANKQHQQAPPKHLSSINFKPTSSSGLASSSFTASSVAASTSTTTSSNGVIGKVRSSFNANLFNVLNTKLSIHEEEHDDEEQAASTSAEIEGDHSFSNTRHGNNDLVVGDNNSSPCGPMLGAGASIALGGMSLGDSPCQGSKPSKLARPGMAPLQPSSTARGLFKPRGMQRASTTIGSNFLGGR